MLKKINDLPKISIVIPSYNKVSYIRNTLQSIVFQRYPNLEIIIQDGASTDGTIDIIKSFAKKYPKLFIWESKKDNGQVDAINKGFKKATGKILAFINADDVYKQSLRSPNGDPKKGALWLVGEHFRDHQDTLWVTGFGDIIDRDGKIISGIVTKYKNTLITLNKYSLLIIVNYITQPSTFVSRSAYVKYGPFTGTKNYVMEYDLWLKLGRVKMPFLIKKTLASFRLTPDNISSTAAKQLLMIDNQITQKYSNNSLLLILHKLHNIGRIFLLNFF